MTGTSCLIIDKAAYVTKDLVLKAISREIINRVDISPLPFPTGFDEKDSGYQTDDTVFMVRIFSIGICLMICLLICSNHYGLKGILTHQECQRVDSSNFIHLQLKELNREGDQVGRCIHLILDQQTSLQWSNNSILKSSSSSQVYKLLILFQSKCCQSITINFIKFVKPAIK
jgi:hypothetical protein